jgi:ubiquinone/menaquinone biosynthesis C-methylase UbiE
MDAELRREMGAFAREWMEKYYNDREMVNHYVRAYKDLLERPEVFQESRFDARSRRQVFLAQIRDDLVWETRKERIASHSGAATVSADNSHALRRPKTGPVPDWIKMPVHDLLKKYTSVRADEVRSVEKRLEATERVLAFVAESEENRWLYRNRFERMDATLPVFDEQRRGFHLDRYRFAAERVGGKRVLDCACGTGYGARLLRETGAAVHVVGIDIEHKAILHALRRHQVGFTGFICASGESLPLGDNSFDVVTSFETIEHVPDDVALVEEFYRVLRADGTLIISTPNQWPLADTPHHVREYDRGSFLNVLEARFDRLELYNQNSGSDTPLNHGQTRGIVPTTDNNEQLAECYIAVCRRKAAR